MKRYFFKSLAFLMIFSTVLGSLSSDLPVKGDILESSIIMYLGNPLASVNGQERFVDPDDYNVTPIMRENKIFVPLNFIGEALGGQLSVSGTRGAKTTLVIDEKTFIFQSNSVQVERSDKSGKEKLTLDAETAIIGNLLYVPMKSAAAILGKEYFYDKGLIVISDTPDIYRPSRDRLNIDAMIARINNLPKIGTEQKFIELVGKPSQWNDVAYNDQYDSETLTLQSATASAASGASEIDYSQTNIQVAGVDEGDKIKTDGRYIYYAGTNTVSVIQATPADNTRVLSTITIDDENFQINELYLEENKLVIVGQTYSKDSGYKPQTLVYLYNAADPTNVKQIKKTVIDGQFNSSRRIGSYLYTVSHVNLYGMVENDTFITPSYTDLNETVSVDFENTYYFPEMCMPTYTLITGIDIDHPTDRVTVNAYFGGEGKLYVSANNLYMAVADRGYNGIIATNRISAVPTAINRNETSTNIYKFSLLRGKAAYSTKATVPGFVLNQFSMDETDEYFRIATTGYTSKGETTNGLYVFNENGELTGKIEGIAIGERIYSVRYVDKRAYMVTFKNTDPLFVIDLKDPKKPTILGALKIPGYSNYLHPYDKNHVIGIGKDTMEYGGTAYDKGIKVALFDVTDVENPVEKYVTYIGERGTTSPILTNHKALLFSQEKNILAFPVSVVEEAFSFQGAYVYGLNLSGGFSLKGKITHMDQDAYLASGLYGGDPSLAVDRILYIGNYFYTFSENLMKVTANTTYGEVSRVVLP